MLWLWKFVVSFFRCHEQVICKICICPINHENKWIRKITLKVFDIDVFGKSLVHQVFDIYSVDECNSTDNWHFNTLFILISVSWAKTSKRAVSFSSTKAPRYMQLTVSLNLFTCVLILVAISPSSSFPKSWYQCIYVIVCL